MAKNNKYYLILPDNETHDYDDFMNNIDEYQNMTFETLNSLKLRYYCQIPDAFGCGGLSDDIKSNDVIRYNKLSLLMNDYLYKFEYKTYLEQHPNEDYDDVLESREVSFIYDILVLRHNLSKDIYSFVKISELEQCIESNIKTQPYDSIINNKTISSQEFDNFFEIFIDKILSLIEEDFCMLFLSTLKNGVNETSSLCIMKENGNSHKDFKKQGLLKNEKAYKGFVFENSYENFKNYMMFNLMFKRPFGCSLNSNITKDHKPGIIYLRKTYGFYIGINGDKIFLEQLHSKEVLESSRPSNKPDKSMPMDKYTIYCGKEKDDFICGFDIV